jgi:hypothetical protein
MKKLIKEVAKFEGLKSEVKIGNIRELLKVVEAIRISDFFVTNSTIGRDYQEWACKMNAKAQKIVNKTPAITYDELVKKLLGRK